MGAFGAAALAADKMGAEPMKEPTVTFQAGIMQDGGGSVSEDFIAITCDTLR